MMCHCSLLCSVDMESSAFAQHLQPFLHGRTDHFVHEFVSFAKSPYDMIAYDEKSSYDFVPMSTSQDHPGNTHVHIQAHAQTYARKNTHTPHTQVAGQVHKAVHSFPRPESRPQCTGQ